MSIQTSQVYEYLDTHPASSYLGDFESLLNMVHFIYTANNPIDSAKIRTGFQSLGHILSQLSPEDEDSLFTQISDICFAYEQESFYHGILFGMHLMTELNAL